MKITDVKATVMDATTLIKIETDENVYGYGEAHCNKRNVSDLRPAIVGNDPTDVERVMMKIRHRGGFKPWGAAVSGIEIALWDIAGKAAGVPVYKLLGGKTRDRVRVYCDCDVGVGKSDDPASVYTPEAYAKKARQVLKAAYGFDMLKFDIGFHGAHGGLLASVPGAVYGADPTYPTRGHATEKGLRIQIEIVNALKDVLGERVGLCLDCGPGQTLQAAMSLCKALETFNLVWAEDLLTGDYNPYVRAEEYKMLSDSTTTPILTGEQIYLRQGFQSLIETHAVDIVSPDVCDVGGIAETKWIADHADLHNVLIAPHNFGHAIEFFANVHAAATMAQNFIAFEFHKAEVSWWEEVVKNVKGPLIRDGFAEIPDGPGLGLELNEKVVTKHLAEGEGFFE